jgi:predicted DsbA family dithiol-disulfide isomerase
MGIFQALKSLAGKQITIYADFIDPFHYLGYHALRPLAEQKGIDMVWQGFELNPDTPLEGFDLETGGNSDLRPGMWASVENLAKTHGLTLSQPCRIPNTRGAHALVDLALQRDVKNPLIDTLYQAYFNRQQDLGKLDVLIELAAGFNIPADRVRTALADAQLAPRLEARRLAAQQRGFLGLPGFVYRGQNHFGALSPEAWKRILEG